MGHENSKPQFAFQVAKQLTGGGDFPSAVKSALEQFQVQAVHNMNRGSGTVLTAVTTPEPGAYFVVVLAGPFESIQALKSGLDAALEQPLVEQMKRIGID